MGRTSDDARIRTESPLEGASGAHAPLDGPLGGPLGGPLDGPLGPTRLRRRGLASRVAPRTGSRVALAALLGGLGVLAGRETAAAGAPLASLIAAPGPFLLQVQPQRQPQRQPQGQPQRQPQGQPQRQPQGQPQRQPQRQPQGRSAGIQPRSTPRSAVDQRPAQGGRAQVDPRRAGDPPTLENPFGAPPETTRLVWFKTADADGTGWVSFREARASIGFDAARFRVFDTDNDGRFTFEEYTEFLRGEALAGRDLLEPRRPNLTREAPPRDAEQLRLAYDVDLDGRISRLELDRILLDYRSSRPSDDSATVMGHLDASGDNFLDLVELERLANYLIPASIDALAGSLARPDPRTVDDLFGAAVERGTASPPRIEGPVPLFRRLDLDGDGYIEVEDLQALEGRALTRVNLASILNTLDLDFDGRLSEGEFLHSMRSQFGR